MWPTLNGDDVRSNPMGSQGEDILLSTRARELVPLSIECKSRATIAVYNWYDQSSTNCPKGSEPLVVLKADRKKPLAMVDAEYFFELMEKRK